MTLLTIMTFLQYLLDQHTRQTADSYYRSVEKFKLKIRNPKKSKYHDIVEYLNRYATNKRTELAGIKKYYHFLLEKGEIESHPCTNLTIKARRSSIQFQELFSMKELTLLLDRPCRYEDLKYRNKLIISLLIYQGLAPENLVNLKENDVDLDNGTIRIKSTQRLKGRVLKIEGKQMFYLMKYLYTERPKLNRYNKELLLIGKLGQDFKVDTLNRLLRPLKQMFPTRNLNANTIRQSVLYNWLNKKQKKLEEVQQMSGHRWLSSIEKYKESDLEVKRKLIKRFHPIK